MWESAWKRLRYGGDTDISWFSAYLTQNAKILEIGCGNGKTYLKLRKQGYDIYGIDIAPTAIARLTEDAKIMGCEVAVKVADARHMDFEENMFDIVLGIHIIDAFAEKSDVCQIINECHRVLKPGGYFVCEVFCVHDMRYGRGKRIDDDVFLRGGIVTRYFDRETLLSVLNPFQVIQILHVQSKKRYGVRCVYRAICRKTQEQRYL